MWLQLVGDAFHHLRNRGCDLQTTNQTWTKASAFGPEKITAILAYRKKWRIVCRSWFLKHGVNTINQLNQIKTLCALASKRSRFFPPIADFNGWNKQGNALSFCMRRFCPDQVVLFYWLPSWSRRTPSGSRRHPGTSPESSRSPCLTSPNSSAKAHREGSYTQVGHGWPTHPCMPALSFLCTRVFVCVCVSVHSQARQCCTNDCRLVNINDPLSLQCCHNQRLVKRSYN